MANFSESELISLIKEFDHEISSSIKAFTGSSPAFTYTEVGDGVSIRLKQENNSPGVIPLKAQGHTILGLAPSFKCSLDSRQRYLAVEHSSIAVYPHRNQSVPLFRFEYVRNQGANYPSSHFHVHAHRDEFSHLLGFSRKIRDSKDKDIKTYLGRVCLVSDFHFPTGGHRFRPCLEDILEVIRVEFNLDVDNSTWQERLQNARVRWREIQTAATVRDNPGLAARILQEEFGLKIPDSWNAPPADIRKLARS